MFGQNLRVDAPNRQLAVLVGVSIFMAVYSFRGPANLMSELVDPFPAEKVTAAIQPPLAELRSNGHNSQTLNPEERHPNCYRLPTEFQGQTIYGVKLARHQKAIALTFDDGPWPHNTSKVLDILQQHHVKATFFVLGSNVAQYPHLLQQVATEGHAIGNHSWSHGYQDHSLDLALSEIQQTTDIVEKYAGFKTTLFRPPGGYLSNGLVAQASTLQMVTVLWTIDDTYEGSVKVAVQNVLENATSGGIVLMHDGGGDRELTIKALPRIISELKQQGYQFVTVPQLLAMAVTGNGAANGIDCYFPYEAS